MIYIDRDTVPYCYIEERKFEWGEPYEVVTPIFNLCINPDLSDMEFTIEVLGQNNFRDNLEKLFNILVNKEENYRIESFTALIEKREYLLNLIEGFLNSNTSNIAPWIFYRELFTEKDYLESIEEDLNRKLLFDRKEY